MAMIHRHWPAVVAALGFAGCGLIWPQPPSTPMRPVVDEIHGERFTDPYRWLERKDDEEVRRWLDHQNFYTDRVLYTDRLFARTPPNHGVGARLWALGDTPEIGRPQRGGGFEYFTLRRPGEQLAAIYRRPRSGAESSNMDVDPAVAYERIVDATPMSIALTVSVDLVAVAHDGSRLIYSVRDGGQDERSLRVMDLKTMAETERLPSALWDAVSLKKDGSGFLYVRRSRETGARVRFHAWGADADDDPVLFGEGYGPTAFVSVEQSDDGAQFIYTVQHGWARSEVWWQDVASGGPPRPLVRDLDAHCYPRFEDGVIWMRTDYQAPMGRVVVVDPAAPAPDAWRTVVAEREDYLEDFTTIDGKIFATYVRDASNRIRVFERSGADQGEIHLPAMVSASIRGDGPGTARLTIQSFTTPSTEYRLDLESGERTVHKPAEVVWHGAGVTTTLVYAASKDGTRVPVFVTGRADRPKDGGNRVLLGGTAASTSPRNRASRRSRPSGSREAGSTRTRSSAAAASSARPGTARAC
jgi:prolyl oligopeptidase